MKTAEDKTGVDREAGGASPKKVRTCALEDSGKEQAVSSSAAQKCSVNSPEHFLKKLYFAVLEMKPRASSMIGKCSPTKPHPQPWILRSFQSYTRLTLDLVA